MTFLQVLSALFIQPILLITEYTYSIVQKGFGDSVISDIATCFTIDVLFLPYYIGLAEAWKKRDKSKNFLEEKTILFKGILASGFQIAFLLALYNFLSELSLTKNIIVGLATFGITHLLFSSVKIFYTRFEKSRKIFNVIFCIIGVALLCAIPIELKRSGSKSFLAIMVLFALVCFAPLIFSFISSKISENKKAIKLIKLQSNGYLFFAAGLYLSVFIGVFIPSTVIKSSPQEFVDIYNYSNPLWFVLSSFCISLGMFVVWFGVIFLILNENMRKLFILLMCTACASFTANYMFFGANKVVLSNALKFAKDVNYSFSNIVVNLCIFIVIAVAVLIVTNIIGEKTPLAIIVPIAIMCVINIFNGVNNCVFINSDMKPVKEIADNLAKEKPSFNLSKEGKNVIVFMLDRGAGEFIPYFINEKPELKDMYDGFTYYPNTISFGMSTNVGSPALFGGYEYTPEEMNKRDEEPLKDKHNEALKVMPVLFYNNGYEVTVCDAPYAGYQTIPDLSIYDDYPEIKTYLSDGYFWNACRESVSSRNYRNFFCYSIMKSMPLAVQNHLYDDGFYNSPRTSNDSFDEYAAESVQLHPNWMIGEGYSSLFMEHYMTLLNLKEMTNIVDGDVNTFMMINNETTHVGDVFLQEPEYDVAYYVDNADYEKKNSNRYNVNGIELNMQFDYQYAHYQENMAALLRVGEWLDYLKAEGVYDNTRIIIVADHGSGLNLSPFYCIDPNEDVIRMDIECYYPLLMIKDFGSRDFRIDEEFMTNADVPTYALDGLIDDPKNPFTGKAINNLEKNAHPQKVMIGSDSIYVNSDNVFAAALWLSVEKDMRDKKNWKILR